MIERYLEVLDLKDVKRTGWQIYNVSNPESVASHSWSVALLTMIYLPEDLEIEKALKMALIHDIGESEIGDIPYRASGGYTSENKGKDEKQVVQEISERLDEKIMSLYRDYSDRQTDEAKFVKDMDLIDMVLQALKYQKEKRYEGNPETDYDDLDEFFETSRSRFRTEQGKEMFNKIYREYEDSKRDA